jgi:hypothetical protein
MFAVGLIHFQVNSPRANLLGATPCPCGRAAAHKRALAPFAQIAVAAGSIALQNGVVVPW